jgi:S-adenosylmethionine-diacylgycerolhomoserine-N-methlytransferase
MPTPRDAVWVDMGGGTGANLEFFRDDFRWKKVFVFDLCAPLLDVARQRVAHNGWEDKVVCVEGDATDMTAIGRKDGLPAKGTVDVLTFSYSLTMIPDWEKALDVAYELVKPGGYIAVCDFTVTKDMSLFTQTVWPAVFKQDGIRLNHEHIPALRARFIEKTCVVNYGGFPYVPLIEVPFFHWVGQKPRQ